MLAGMGHAAGTGFGPPVRLHGRSMTSHHRSWVSISSKLVNGLVLTPPLSSQHEPCDRRPAVIVPAFMASRLRARRWCVAIPGTAGRP